MKDWIVGMDLSTLPEVERCGGRFYDHGQEGDALELLRRYGMNLVRVRLWNDPYSPEGEPYGAGTNDLKTAISLARRARAAGADWLLDFHYSDFWADPEKQRLPKAWVGLDADGLTEAVHDYTAEVLEALKRENLLPAMVAVGNELTHGLLWPLGEAPNFGNIARFLSAGIRAVREVSPASGVMLHLDNGGNNALYRNWFDSYLACGGADFDCIGLSYYPFWHGTLAMLRENLNDLALRYGKPLIIAETSMGFTMEDYQRWEQLPPEKRKGMATRPALVEQIDYPMTPEGQCDFLADLLRVVADVPQGLGKGFVYWEPAWLPVPGVGWANDCALAYIQESGPGGNEWANQALFDYDGNALPALETIRMFRR